MSDAAMLDSSGVQMRGRPRCRISRLSTVKYKQTRAASGARTTSEVREYFAPY